MKARHGFTLIELLIVVAIIGILAAIAVPNFLNAQVRAKVSRALADLRSLRTAIEMYSVDKGRPIMDHGEYVKAGIPVDGRIVWGKLTSPIAYITESAFHDPFIPDFNGTAAQEVVVFGYYQYRYVKFMIDNNTQGAAQHGDRTTKWLARSPGPDRIYIPYPEKVAYWMAYMASNGLKSPGDLMVTDKGILGINFPGQDQR